MLHYGQDNSMYLKIPWRFRNCITLLAQTLSQILIITIKHIILKQHLLSDPLFVS